jgi:hypothetical protein
MSRSSRSRSWENRSIASQPVHGAEEHEHEYIRQPMPSRPLYARVRNLVEQQAQIRPSHASSSHIAVTMESSGSPAA